ncbi:MAG: nudC 2 [Firmicutes bacterium]|nr:nudC 2 [Bacillota bacterium]
MADNSIYNRYVPAVIPQDSGTGPACMFIFSSSKILIKDDLGHPSIPASSDFNGRELLCTSRQYLGELDGYPCYCLDLDDKFIAPADMIFKDLRSLLGQLQQDIFLLAGRAFQIVNWNRMNKFCGKCGTLTEPKQGELAKFCPSCQSVYYTRISPAVIVAVVRDDKILLAHNKNFRPNWFSVIAGFVEPGETFEDCVKREVMEEVGIEVKNIRYFGSEPWPFPDSLMVGFIAEYHSGEIIVDGQEIDVAGWYGRDNLPPRPANHTIAGQLIEAVLFK